MKTTFYILFVFFELGKIESQSYQLIDSKHYPDNSKNCKLIGNCISKKVLKNDTLYLTIFIDNNGRELSAYRDSFSFFNDTLYLILKDTNRIESIIRYDSLKNKIDTIYIINTPVMKELIGSYDFQKFEYIITGFKQIPKKIQFNWEDLCDCPQKPIKFEIFNNDTINLINANGNEHGLWIKFFDTGQIESKRYYDNGMFKSGKTFDKNGKDLHFISHSDGDIDYMFIDTLIMK